MYLTPTETVRDYEAKGWWAGESVNALLRRAVERSHGAVGLVDPINREQLDGRTPQRLTWAEIDGRVDEICALLYTHGLRKDDIILAQLPNTIDAVLLFLACARMGLILSPVAMQYRAHELAYVVEKVSPSAVVTVPQFAGYDHAAQAAKLGPRVLLFGAEGDGLRGAPDQRSLDEARAYIASHPTEGGEVLTICWTSGTESRPKGVPRDHNHWILNGELVAEGTGMIDGETLLNPFPLVNIGSIGGLVMPWLLFASKLVLHHPFDLGIFLRQIDEEKVSYTIAPPAVLTALLKQPQLLAGFDISSLRAVASGSAPLSPWLIEGWRDRGIDVTNVFGSNEGAAWMSGAAEVPDCADRARYFPRHGADGQAWPGSTVHAVVRTRLVDLATGEDISEPGRPGELRFTGATTFPGYWDSPELNRASFDERGWFCSGDLFEIAGDGPLSRFYRFVGRSKEIIVRGGVNVSPAELDDLLVGWPAIREAATVGIPDDVLGERIAVAVVPADGAHPTIEDLQAFLKARDVAIFKWPERLIEIDKLPRNAMNKVVRSELREQVLAKL